jgi:hypothetical protein
MGFGEDEDLSAAATIGIGHFFGEFPLVQPRRTGSPGLPRAPTSALSRGFYLFRAAVASAGSKCGMTHRDNYYQKDREKFPIDRIDLFRRTQTLLRKYEFFRMSNIAQSFARVRGVTCSHD